MTVHVFGNCPSPAVATYGIHRCVAHSDPDVIDLVSNNFYVDDGLLSCPSEEVAADLMKRTQLVRSPWICIASECAREDVIPPDAINFQ